ncbi:hypothetical protein BDV06DRAFT_228654 [Aspergillus oleicola]
MTTRVSISPVSTTDIDTLARNVIYPAAKDDPLQRVTFSRTRSDNGTNVSTTQGGSREREEEILWHRDSLLMALQRGNEFLHKACTAVEDHGENVAIIGWTLDPGVSNKMLEVRRSEIGFEAQCTGAEEKSKVESETPASLDVAVWLAASKRLREERERILGDYRRLHPDKGICRITYMAVAPTYQRHGFGSALMEMFCQHIGNCGLDAFVMSSPAGVRLYAKSGFKSVGVVEIGGGQYTSMLRVI